MSLLKPRSSPSSAQNPPTAPTLTSEQRLDPDCNLQSPARAGSLLPLPHALCSGHIGILAWRAFALAVFSPRLLFYHSCMAHSFISFRTLPKALPGLLTYLVLHLLQFVSSFLLYFFLFSHYDYVTNCYSSCLWSVSPTRM